MAVSIDTATLLALCPHLDPATAAVMIQGAVARAAQIAPCILADDFTKDDAAVGIILDALVRRSEGGSGSVTQQAAGPFSQSVDTRSLVNLFTAQERADLAALCPRSKTAYTLNTAPGGPLDEWAHARINGPLGTAPGGL